jgi:hypothetical protein
MTTAIRWLAGITAALVLVQAALIGQALFLGDAAKQELHGWVGNLSLLGAVGMAGCATVAVRRGEPRGPALWLSVLVVLLMVAQLGLGYVGRRGGMPAAIHIPNGVLIVGLLSAVLTVALLPAPAATRSRV